MMEKNTKFITSAFGIFICYFYFGVIQERITRGKYSSKEGEDEERFTYTLSLVFVQCIANYVFARLLVLNLIPQGEDTTKTWYYSSSALTYLLGMVSSNMALQWVNFPTQVIAKSCKPIPVMVLGVLLGKKRYLIRKYVFVILIVAGIALFMLKDGKSGPAAEGGIGVGEVLLLASLSMDGLTGAVQERMKAEHETRSGHMMLQMNKWSCLFVGIPVVLTGEVVKFSAFVGRHPAVAWHLGSLAVAGAFGQFFILVVVSDFGPLPCSIITTTRKFFTVLGSVLLFGNSLASRQWIGTIFVFTGLFLDAVYGKSSPKKK
ncbi:solute carrier family 35 member B1 homolog [Ischnura elegans]|uniref:solute carrier family 35 member B1 homolog n=1 Tax=Ischnura elegans TaxID=197161 RepID=UPI001ED891EE|nr:solute carrier family 35 member B1 homolog [Ischnura elegans]